MQEKTTSNFTIGGILSNKGGLKRIAEVVLKHIHGNAATYITLIETLAHRDYPAAITCLKVIILREVTGGIQRQIERRKKNNDDTKK